MLKYLHQRHSGLRLTVRAGAAISLALVCAFWPLPVQAQTRGPNNVMEWDQPPTSADGSPLLDMGGWAVYIQSAPGAGPASASSARYFFPAASPAVSAIFTKSVRLGDFVPRLTNGNKWFCVTALDLTGNESPCSPEVSFPFDGVAPAVPVSPRTR